MSRFLYAIGLLAICAPFAHCQADFTAAGQYPQFRGISGLPGSGFGILPNGTPDFHGAMSYTSPIAYSLNNWHFAITAENASDYWFFRLPHVTQRNGNQDSNGKLNFMAGIPLGKYGSLTISQTIISSLGDGAFNFQYQFPLLRNGIGLAFGSQDFRGSVHNAGAENVPGGDGLSRTFYGVVTVPLPRGIYASAGFGDRRFKYGFANISVPFGDRFKAVVEHDGFDFDEAIAYHPNAPRNLTVFGKPAEFTMMIGYEKTKYAFWSLNLSF